MLNNIGRRTVLVGAVLGIAAVTGACGARPTATVGEPVVVIAPQTSLSTPPAADSTPPPATSDPSGAQAPPIDPESLVRAAESVEPNTTLGAVVFDRVIGAAPLSINGDVPFRSASLVKLLIAIDALHRGATESERQSLAHMLSVSDDNIASAFWTQGGAGAIVTRSVALVGLTGTEPPEQSGKWGEVKVTPNDMVRVYQYVMDALPIADHTLIVDALAQAPQFAADDFDQYFGIPDGMNTQWAIKQGWGNNDSAMVLHSTGLVGAKWRYVVVLMTKHPLGSGWRTSADSVTAAAGALQGLLPEA
jgi:hypothetical protein